MKNHTNALVTDLETAEILTGYSRETLHKLLYLNRGSDDGSMKTLGLYLSVTNHHAYQITSGSVQLVSHTNNQTIINLENTCKTAINTTPPPFLELDAIWDPDPVHSGNKNNILGDNGRLLLNNPAIEIPCVEATNEFLSYYGGLLIQPGEIVTFPDHIYPIWQMHIRRNYINQFLMTDDGGGFYLEYHDQPHYHHALNGEGYYLLAKWNHNHTRMQITGFKIPNGHAIYTRKGAIHCDAGLIGDYLVGYTIAKACSTVLLRSLNPEKMVSIHFVECDS
jgi:hypothetical protein